MRPTLALAALSLVAACGGSPAAPSSTSAGAAGAVSADGPASAQTFTIRGTDSDTFSPATLTAKVGTLTLTLRNGGVPHNLTFQDPALTSISTVSGKETKSATLVLDKAGTFTFVCTIHPGMAGKLVVVP